MVFVSWQFPTRLGISVAKQLTFKNNIKFNLKIYVKTNTLQKGQPKYSLSLLNDKLI